MTTPCLSFHGRSPNTVFLFTRGLLSAETKIYRVRKEHVRGAILWLINNCPPYMQHVSVSEDNLNGLPLNGSVFDDAFGLGRGGVCADCQFSKVACRCRVHVLEHDHVGTLAAGAEDLVRRLARGP